MRGFSNAPAVRKRPNIGLEPSRPQFRAVMSRIGSPWRAAQAERYAASIPRDCLCAIDAKRTFNASRAASLVKPMEERIGPRRAVLY
jgi:hypothetical protein